MSLSHINSYTTYQFGELPNRFAAFRDGWGTPRLYRIFRLCFVPGIDGAALRYGETEGERSNQDKMEHPVMDYPIGITTRHGGDVHLGPRNDCGWIEGEMPYIPYKATDLKLLGS